MPYRAPGAYATFTRTAGPVNNPGATRVMGLIGTGLNYYEVYNEPIVKSDDKAYDQLSHSNVFEIMNISSSPVFSGKNNPNNHFYKLNSDFTLENGEYIAWKLLSEPSVSVHSIDKTGSVQFLTHVTCDIDEVSKYEMQDGNWSIEVTYVDEEYGTFRVINLDTEEIVGEYTVSSLPQLDIIPGVMLVIKSTFDSEDRISVGDYVTVKTIAGKTEQEPTVAFDNGVTNYSSNLESEIQSLMIVYPAKVVDGSYVLTITDVTTHLFSIKDSNGNEVFSGVIGGENEYLEVIPGITFIFDTLPTAAVNGDSIKIVTTARITGAAPSEGSAYYVSYKYHKSDEDYDPQIFFDYDDVVTAYGNYDVTASSIVINSLSLGAEIAFQNGVVPLVCVQARNDSDYEMEAAIDKLQRTLPGVNNINTVIALTDSPYVGAYLVTHVDYMSSTEQAKERMTYIGASQKQLLTKSPTALDRSIGMVETAQAYNDERVVFVTPGEAIKSIRDLRTGQYVDRKLPACYMAVAAAALGLVNDPAEPLTRKKITGFKQLTTILMESEKNFLASAGCLVLEQVGSNIRVRHGITTSTTDVNSVEITLIQIKDYVIDAVRVATGNLYVGMKNKPSVLADVQYTISSILNQFISAGIIIGFDGLSVKRSKDDPRQIDVRFEIEAVYPLNYISITFGFSAVS